MKLCDILYIEDDPSDVLLAEVAFRRAHLPCKLHRVADGDEAIGYLTARGRYSDRGRYPVPDLILMDLTLPLVDGFDLLAWIRDRPELHKTPVLVLNDTSSPADRLHSEALGADWYFEKTGDFIDVLACVAALLPLPSGGKPVSQAPAGNETARKPQPPA